MSQHRRPTETQQSDAIAFVADLLRGVPDGTLPAASQVTLGQILGSAYLRGRADAASPTTSREAEVQGMSYLEDVIRGASSIGSPLAQVTIAKIITGAYLRGRRDEAVARARASQGAPADRPLASSALSIAPPSAAPVEPAPIAPPTSPDPREASRGGSSLMDFVNRVLDDEDAGDEDPDDEDSEDEDSEDEDAEEDEDSSDEDPEEEDEP